MNKRQKSFIQKLARDYFKITLEEDCFIDLCETAVAEAKQKGMLMYNDAVSLPHHTLMAVVINYVRHRRTNYYRTLHILDNLTWTRRKHLELVKRVYNKQIRQQLKIKFAEVKLYL